MKHRPSFLRDLLPSMLAIAMITASATCQTTQPATEPGPAATTPATAPAATQPAAPASPAQEWLTRISEKSARIKSLHADLRYDRIQPLMGDRQRRFGRLVYEAGPPARFAIQFDRLLVDRRMEKQNRWYIFDGVWFVEKLEDQKQFFKRQVVAPGTPPDKADPLALGEGPFVVPITANKERILQRFDVQLAEPAPGDPASSVHLVLTPKEGQRVDFQQVDLWYGRESLLPLQAKTTEESGDQSILVLSKVQMNEPVNVKLLDTTEPTDDGWRVEVTPWEER